MSNVARLFSRNVVDDSDDAEIEELAHESANAAESRYSQSAKLEDLLSGLEDLKKLNRFRKGPLRTYQPLVPLPHVEDCLAARRAAEC